MSGWIFPLNYALPIKFEFAMPIPRGFKSVLDARNLPHLWGKWSDTLGRVPLCTEPGHNSGPLVLRSAAALPFLRIPDSQIFPMKCCRCLSFLLPSWRRLGDSHATTQCLNKRVCLIQLSPQDCAKWALVLCDRDNEWAERRRRVGCRGLKRDTCAHSNVHTSFALFSTEALMCPGWPSSFSTQ